MNARIDDVTRLNQLTGSVIGAAMAVHSGLGAGLLESAYQHALAIELGFRGIAYQREVALPATYRGIRLDSFYRLDFLVEGSLIVEAKAVSQLAPIHTSQLLTYLRLARLPIGLILNFHENSLRRGIKRVANTFVERNKTASST